MAVNHLGKKGMFLTFMSISIIAAVIIMFTPSDINLRKDISVIKTRVSNVNDYILDLENVYLERTLQATGRKTIIALINYMDTRKEFLTDLQANFKEVLLNGTIENIPIDDIIGQDIMKGNTYINWTDKVKNISKNTFNVDTDFTIHDIRIYQIRPWFVNVDANISFNVSSETASWNKNVVIKTEIAIENFDDPYYLVITGGDYNNKINKSDVKFDEWHIENVSDHIRYGTYVHWENGNAPSFLMRFTEDISASSCCGIESIVNRDKLVSLGLPADIYLSYVDYLFWTTSAGCVYTVDDINPDNNNFDFEHLVLYNRTLGAIQICPPPPP